VPRVRWTTTSLLACRAGGKVTIPLLVREVSKIREGDYVRISTSELIKKKQQQKQKEERGKKKVGK